MFIQSRFGEHGLLRIVAFDFFNTLDKHEDVRMLARRLFHAGYEVHVVSAISPGLPLDDDRQYAMMMSTLQTPYTKIWRVDHKPELKIEVLQRIGAQAFWDDLKENVDAARAAGISTCHVGVDPHHITSLEILVNTAWSVE